MVEKTYPLRVFDVVNKHNMRNGMVWLGIAMKTSGGHIAHNG